VADVLAAVIVAQRQTVGHVLAEGAEALAHPLPDRLERLEAIPAAAGVEADALGRAVIDGDEHRGLALASHHRGQVGAPHKINAVGGDRAVVGARAARAASTLVRQQTMLARQPQDAAPAGTDAGGAQPCPYLPVALAMKWAGRQKLPNRPHQLLVRHRAERPGPPALDRPQPGAMAVDGRP
jgi:hypothetical protein